MSKGAGINVTNPDGLQVGRLGYGGQAADGLTHVVLRDDNGITRVRGSVLGTRYWARTTPRFVMWNRQK